VGLYIRHSFGMRFAGQILYYKEFVWYFIILSAKSIINYSALITMDLYIRNSLRLRFVFGKFYYDECVLFLSILSAKLLSLIN